MTPFWHPWNFLRVTYQPTLPATSGVKWLKTKSTHLRRCRKLTTIHSWLTNQKCTSQLANYIIGLSFFSGLKIHRVVVLLGLRNGYSIIRNWSMCSWKNFRILWCHLRCPINPRFGERPAKLRLNCWLTHGRHQKPVIWPQWQKFLSWVHGKTFRCSQIDSLVYTFASLPILSYFQELLSMNYFVLQSNRQHIATPLLV